MWTVKQIFEFIVLASLTLTVSVSFLFNQNRVRADALFFKGDLYGAHLTDPYSYKYAYALGTALLAQKKAKEAVPYLEKATTLHPNYPDAFNNLAVAYLKVGEYRHGLDLIDKTFKKWPTHPAVKANKEMGDRMRKSMGARAKKRTLYIRPGKVGK